MLLSQRNGNTTTHLGALLGGPNTRLSGRRGDVSGVTTYSIGGKNLDTVFDGIITNGINQCAITKVGTGKLTLTGISPYSGATIIEGGTLQVDGHVTSSGISVNGGTLPATARSARSSSSTPGGTISPGDSIGQLTITARSN
jgi:autotransporter-associated beta strand protein